MTVVVILLVASLFCACNGNDIQPGVPISWENYLSELADTVADGLESCGQIIAFSFSGNALFGEKYFEIILKGNIDLSDMNGDNVALIVSDSDGKTKFSVLSDNNDTYIEIAPNPYVSNAKLKLQQTFIFGLLSGVYNQDDGVDFHEKVKRGIITFGRSFFESADVNEDKSKYSFGINGELLGKRMFEFFTALSFADKEITNVVLGIFGIKNIDELLSNFDNVDGDVEFYIEDGRLSRVEIGDAIVGDMGKSNLALDISVSGEYDASVDELFPKSDDGYKVTKVGSTTMDGTVSMISSVGNKYAVKYGMTLNTDIDLFALALSGFNLDVLSEDNFFHFRLSHKCTASCTEYCKSRMSSAKGAVVDIAFSPSHFGTHNIYISLNIKSLMSREYVDGITKYVKSITASSLPDYCMLVVPASKLKEDGVFLKLLYDTYIKMMNIGVGETDTVDLNRIREEFSDNKLAETILGDMLGSEEYDIDILKIRVNKNVYGQAYDYDIYKETVYLIDTEVSGVKSYKTPLGKDYTAYRWEYEGRKAAKDGVRTYSLNNIYDLSGNNLLHGADADGNYVPMSDIEAKELVGCSLKLDYAGYDGINKTAFGEIMAADGIDYQNFDVQEITLRVKYPSIFDYTFEFGDITEKVMEGFFRCGNDEFTQTVKVNIKLTKEIENAFEFKSADTDKVYMLTYMSSAPELLSASAFIHYENGAVKEISALGVSDSVLETRGILTRYSIVDWGRITVKFRVAGRTVDRYFNIRKPDSFEFTTREYTEKLGESCYIDNYVTVRAVYDGQKVTLKLSLKDFYINGLSLNDDSADWDHYTSYTNRYVVFYKSGDYNVQVKKLGVVFGDYLLHITNKLESTPTYKFDTQSELPSVVFPNVKININGSIVNKTHGDGEGGIHTVEVKVEEYVVSGTMILYADADKNDYSLQLKIASETVDPDSKTEVFLPALVINPVNLQMSLIFNKAGTYRLSVRLDRTTVYTATITVIV